MTGGRGANTGEMRLVTNLKKRRKKQVSIEKGLDES